MYEKEFLEEQKQTLLKEKQELTKTLSGFAVQDKNDPDNWNTRYPKMNDNEEESVDEVEEYTDLLPAEYALEIKLKTVNQALEDIEKGTYGKCEECGKQISEERLMANPASRKCVECMNQ